MSRFVFSLGGSLVEFDERQLCVLLQGDFVEGNDVFNHFGSSFSRAEPVFLHPFVFMDFLYCLLLLRCMSRTDTAGMNFLSSFRVPVCNGRCVWRRACRVVRSRLQFF